MRAVLLLHELPDGTSHYDWMIERCEQGPLVAFRVGERIDVRTCFEWTAQRLPDHRRAYLDYEGEVSGGRGHVRRVASGKCEIHTLDDDLFVLMLTFHAFPRRVVGQPRGQDQSWHFIADPAPCA